MSRNVYMLWFHPKNDPDEDDGLLIGVYESEADAVAAIERVKNKPGFVDDPGGFRIYPRELGKDSWTEGFIRN